MSNPTPLRRVGKYEIIGRIAVGGMGTVFRARDPLLDREVALKVILGDGDDAEIRARFEREARSVANISHGNIVTIFEFGYHEGSPFIAMELLRGRDLGQAMQATPSMTIEERIGVVRQVLTGLGRAHKAGVVHRDIKPANIFVTTDGEVKILDFGVARIAGGSMTGTGKILGSPFYMSPEQWTSGTVDGRSDLFSTGVTLYELIAGVKPFVGDSPFATMKKTLSDEADFSLIRTYAPALIPILQKALAKDPEARYQSAADFATAIESIGMQSLTQVTTSVVPSPPSSASNDSLGEMLAAAAESGQEHVVRELLALGANVDGRMSHGRTTLMHAAKRGHTAIATFLLERGADVNAADEYGNTPLSCAALGGALDIFAALMKSGADPTTKSTNGVTVLMEAADGGNVAIVEQLLRDGRVSLEAKDSANNTALYFAFIRGLKLTYKALLVAGADPNIIDIVGNTCLGVAAREGWFDVVLDLLDHGADPNLPGARPPALIAAAQSDRCEAKIVQLLLERGADHEARDPSGKTAAMYASERGQIEKLRALIRGGPSLATTIEIASPTVNVKQAMPARTEEEASKSPAVSAQSHVVAVRQKAKVSLSGLLTGWLSPQMLLIALVVVLGTGWAIYQYGIPSLIKRPPATKSVTTSTVESTPLPLPSLLEKYDAALAQFDFRFPPVTTAQRQCIERALTQAVSGGGRLYIEGLRRSLNNCAATSEGPRGASPLIAVVQAQLAEVARRGTCRTSRRVMVDGRHGSRTSFAFSEYFQCTNPKGMPENMETLGDFVVVGISLIHEHGIAKWDGDRE